MLSVPSMYMCYYNRNMSSKQHISRGDIVGIADGDVLLQLEYSIQTMYRLPKCVLHLHNVYADVIGVCHPHDNKAI